MPNVYLITGDDVATIQDEARKLADKLSGPNADEFSREVYKESDDRPSLAVLNEFIGAILTPSFLGGQKVVWLQHFSGFDQDGVKSSDLGKALTVLVEHLERGIPEDIVVLMDGAGAKETKPLAKAVKAIGRLSVKKKPDVSKRGWQETVRGLITDQATQRNMVLDRQIVAYMVEVIGTDTARIASELEKIFCYGGNRPSLEEVMALCAGTHEAVYYALNEAIDKRNLNACLETISQFMEHSRNPDSECIRLVRMLARHVRDLLHTRLLLGYLHVSNPEALPGVLNSLNAEERERFAGNPMLDKSPYILKLNASAAARYQGPELVDAVRYLAEADRALVSSQLPKRLLLETLVTRIVSGQAAQV